MDRAPIDHAAIAAAYDRIAERWLEHRFDAGNGVAAHVRALALLDDAPGGWALNAGCGCNPRFSPLLRARGLRIEGVDISARMVELARTADPQATIHHADLCDWPIPRAYRFITGWDSLWHVALGAQRRLMRSLMTALEPGGVFVFSAGGLDAPAEHRDAAMGPSVYYATLGIPGLLDVVRDAGCVPRHLEFDQRPHDHLCVIVQRPR
ncbi:MAG: class I SAM-dependent methyltransferase [Lautropia sp.]